MHMYVCICSNCGHVKVAWIISNLAWPLVNYRIVESELDSLSGWGWSNFNQCKCEKVSNAKSEEVLLVVLQSLRLTEYTEKGRAIRRQCRMLFLWTKTNAPIWDAFTARDTIQLLLCSWKQDRIKRHPLSVGVLGHQLWLTAHFPSL